MSLLFIPSFAYTISLLNISLLVLFRLVACLTTQSMLFLIQFSMNDVPLPRGGRCAALNNSRKKCLEKIVLHFVCDCFYMHVDGPMGERVFQSARIFACLNPNGFQKFGIKNMRIASCIMHKSAIQCNESTSLCVHCTHFDGTST